MNIETDTMLETVNQIIKSNFGCSVKEIRKFENDPIYPNGYLIERKLQGIAADKILFDREQEMELYVKLAQLVSSIHNIKIKNFGYIGSGIACYESMTSFFEDEFDRLDNGLKEIITSLENAKKEYIYRCFLSYILIAILIQRKI